MLTRGCVCFRHWELARRKEPVTYLLSGVPLGQLELSFSFFKIYFIDYAITVVPFPPLIPLCPAHPLPPTFPPYSSCLWVIHISSLASTFPTLFLTSPCPFSTYHLCFLFPVPSPHSLPYSSLLIILHVISISVFLF